MGIQTTSDIGGRTAGVIAAELLKRAHPSLVLQQFGQLKPIPKNSSATIKFRRYDALAPADTPLQEGVTPTGSSPTSTDYSATLQQFGDWVGITDMVADTHEDPIIKEYTGILAKQMAETVEKALFGTLKAGTNVFFANGTARTDVNTTLTRGLLRKVVRGFERQNAGMLTTQLSSNATMDTVNVPPAYIAVCHVDLRPTVEGLSGFKDVVDYGGESKYLTEIGSVGNVRFITSTMIEPWADGGGVKAGSGTTMISTTGTSADVYPILFFAENAFGVTPLKGEDAMTPFVVNPGKADSYDKLGQQGHIGWKTYFTSLILNQLWMARAEVAVPEL